jgi:hypothetical protein
MKLLTIVLSALLIAPAVGLPQSANAEGRGTGRIAAADCDKGSRECFPEETVQPT